MSGDFGECVPSNCQEGWGINLEVGTRERQSSRNGPSRPSQSYRGSAMRNAHFGERAMAIITPSTASTYITDIYIYIISRT